MSVLVLFTLGFAGAMAVFTLNMQQKWIVLFICLAAVGLIVSGSLSKKCRLFAAVAPITAGFILAGGWYLLYGRIYLNPALELDSRTQAVSFEVTDYSEESNYGSVAECFLTIEGKPYQVRVYLDDDVVLSPGDRITGNFRFRYTAPGGMEEATYHRGKGVFLLAYQDGEAVFAFLQDASLRYAPARLRRGIGNLLDSLFPEDVAAFSRALMLGDSSELSYETETDFCLSGIRHIIAVSGLHVSILYGVISTVTVKRRYLTVILGIPALLLFAAVAGFTPSVCRACLMIGLMMLSVVFNREYDPPSALSFAVVIMLLVNPMVITSAGFQLSVASVSGIYLFCKPLQQWLHSKIGGGKGILGKLGGGVAASAGISVSATIFTTPLTAYYFQTVSLVGVLTNLLTIWVISFIFCGILLACVLSLFWASGAFWTAKIVSLPARFVLAVSGFLAGLPFSAVYTSNVYMTIWLIFLYILLIMFLISRKKRPGVLACCAVIGLCAAMLAGWSEPLTDECRVTVLDVGQGQSILLQSEGKTYLVDCGGDREDETADLVAQTLLGQGIDRLDGIILTHYDKDHSGGLGNLLTRVDADLVLLPAVDAGNGELDQSVQTDGTVIYVDRDLELTYGNTVMMVYGPVFAEESNENSLCVLFRTENCDILITGDRSGFGERALLRNADLPQVDLLIAGHHGSRYSTCEELLREIKPETVIISVGQSNPYGHPAQEVLDRLAAAGCRVYRTDLNGTIIYRR